MNHANASGHPVSSSLPSAQNIMHRANAIARLVRKKKFSEGKRRVRAGA
jgi:hypothetical protein